MTDISLEGQVVIVTGAGRGLGRAYALALAARGAHVVVNDLAEAHADEVVTEIESAGGVAVASYESVASAEGGQAIVSAAVDRFERVDAVINNAGNMRNGFFEDMSIDDFDAVLDVHLRGAFFVTQPAWRLMKEQRYGRIVMTSSPAGMFARPYSCNYSTAKAGLYGFCKALAFEGEEHGIAVNAILPRAAAGSAMTATSPVPRLAHNDPPQEVSDILQPRRLTEAVAPLVVYLASRACSVSGEAFSSGYGFHGRVFVGLGPGWVGADPATVTVDDIAERIDEIRCVEDGTVPLDNADELRSMARAITAATAR